MLNWKVLNLIVEVRDSRKGYLVPVRDGPGASPDWRVVGMPPPPSSFSRNMFPRWILSPMSLDSKELLQRYHVCFSRNMFPKWILLQMSLDSKKLLQDYHVHFSSNMFPKWILSQMSLDTKELLSISRFSGHQNGWFSDTQSISSDTQSISSDTQSTAV